MTGLSEHEGDTTTEASSVKVRHDGRVVAAAEIAAEATGTAKVSLQTPHGAPPESRSELVDKVLDHPAVQDSDSLRVVMPLGDSEAINRLQQRTTNVNARAAGASSIVEAEVPRPGTD